MLKLDFLSRTQLVITTVMTSAITSSNKTAVPTTETNSIVLTGISLFGSDTLCLTTPQDVTPSSFTTTEQLE